MAIGAWGEVVVTQTVQPIHHRGFKIIPKQTWTGDLCNIISRMDHCIRLIHRAAHHQRHRHCHDRRLSTPMHLCSLTINMPCSLQRQRQISYWHKVEQTVQLDLISDGTQQETLWHHQLINSRLPRHFSRHVTQPNRCSIYSQRMAPTVY